MNRYHIELRLDYVIECEEYELPEAVAEEARLKLEDGVDIWEDNVVIDKIEEIE